MWLVNSFTSPNCDRACLWSASCVWDLITNRSLHFNFVGFVDECWFTVEWWHIRSCLLHHKHLQHSSIVTRPNKRESMCVEWQVGNTVDYSYLIRQRCDVAIAFRANVLVQHATCSTLRLHTCTLCTTQATLTNPIKSFYRRWLARYAKCRYRANSITSDPCFMMVATSYECIDLDSVSDTCI